MPTLGHKPTEADIQTISQNIGGAVRDHLRKDWIPVLIVFAQRTDPYRFATISPGETVIFENLIRTLYEMVTLVPGGPTLTREPFALHEKRSPKSGRSRGKPRRRGKGNT